MSKGFDRLRSISASGALAVSGLFGAISARAATVSTDLTVTRVFSSSTVKWDEILNFTNLSFNATSQGLSAPNSTTAFAMSDAGLTVVPDRWADAFDGGIAMAVNNTFFINPDSTVDLTGNTLTTDVQIDIVPGIDAQMQYYFFDFRATVRGRLCVSNTSSTAQSVDIKMFTDLGSDGATVVEATSSGGSTISQSDFWFITGDSTTFDPSPGPSNKDPYVLTSRFVDAGTSPVNAITPGAGEEDIAFRWPTTISPGQEQCVVVFHELFVPDPSLFDDVLASAADYNSLESLQAANLLEGLTPEEVARSINIVDVRNFIPTESTSSIPAMTPLGLILGATLVGGIGAAAARRRRQETDEDVA